MAVQKEATDLCYEVARVCAEKYSAFAAKSELRPIGSGSNGQASEDAPHLGWQVLLEDHRRMDWVLRDGSDMNAHRDLLSVAQGTGWQIFVLVPSHRLGDAHRHLRGLAVRLQGWSISEEGDCAFSAAEVP